MTLTNKTPHPVHKRRFYQTIFKKVYKKNITRDIMLSNPNKNKKKLTLIEPSSTIKQLFICN